MTSTEDNLIKQPIFRDLSADDPEPETTEIESLCVNCHKNGITRVLLTKIPFYKEVVIMSFSCDECGYSNNEIQPGGQISEKGIRITLSASTPRDLNRQVIKSDYTSVKILEIDFEIPAQSQKGEVTTVEGIINRSIRGLEQDQASRRIEHSEAAKQIDDFILELKKLKDLESPFTLILEDISGNSHIENPDILSKDSNCTVQYFKRTTEQDHELGIYSQQEINETPVDKGILHPIREGEFTFEQLQSEIFHFATNCTNCASPCETNMKMTQIPHFKEVVIMATNCDNCGHRTNEVKSGGGIEEKGLRIEVSVARKEDFSRDLLKSDTCYLSIPELSLEVGSTALGGRFTTVEGILHAMKDQLIEQSHMFTDSKNLETQEKFSEFLSQLDEVLSNKKKITLILDDPAGNSYVQSMLDDDELDEGLKITRYERSFDQNEELGLNDMKTENYEQL